MGQPHIFSPRPLPTVTTVLKITCQKISPGWDHPKTAFLSRCFSSPWNNLLFYFQPATLRPLLRQNLSLYQRRMTQVLSRKLKNQRRKMELKIPETEVWWIRTFPLLLPPFCLLLGPKLAASQELLLKKVCIDYQKEEVSTCLRY